MVKVVGLLAHFPPAQKMPSTLHRTGPEAARIAKTAVSWSRLPHSLDATVCSSGLSVDPTLYQAHTLPPTGAETRLMSGRIVPTRVAGIVSDSDSQIPIYTSLLPKWYSTGRNMESHLVVLPPRGETDSTTAEQADNTTLSSVGKTDKLERLSHPPPEPEHSVSRCPWIPEAGSATFTLGRHTPSRQLVPATQADQTQKAQNAVYQTLQTGLVSMAPTLVDLPDGKT
ncbi:unnamed protein product [Protopolystoma xenopodis]|uniref:Uncharacterized protein n=1 Tax=Protopolystoma xenopodis TaxID=117903 RepID=A0A3S5BR52_9PLAT|nr:unnamed protein product [Protopolystoma xenopodis]